MRIEIIILATLLAAVAALSIKPRRNEIQSMYTYSQRQHGEARIAGGEEAPLHKFPYHVALYLDGNHARMSGSLINDKWVLTTAYVAKRLPAEDALAVLGAQVPDDIEVTQQRIAIDLKIIHESYNDSYLFANNIALLRLKTSAQLDRFVSPIMLAPFNSPDFDGARLVITGFGWTSATGGPSKSLRYILLNGISNSVCERMYREVDDSNVRVETTGGKGGCGEDQGGPLVDVDRGLLVGLLVNDGACTTSPLPNVFTRVSYFNRWIMDNIENNSNNVK